MSAFPHARVTHYSECSIATSPRCKQVAQPARLANRAINGLAKTMMERASGDDLLLVRAVLGQRLKLLFLLLVLLAFPRRH